MKRTLNIEPHYRRRFVVLAAAMASSPLLAEANPVYWNSSTDGNWSNPSNWFPALPGNGDDVSISGMVNVTYDYTGVPVTLNSLSADFVDPFPINFGAATLTISANTLSCLNYENIGIQGFGSIAQSGGSNSAGSLNLGALNGAIGTYTLGGSAQLSVSGAENVGWYGSSNNQLQGGTGTFVQSGGTNTVGPLGYLSVGNFGGAIGTYTQSGGVLSTPQLLVGTVGAGSFAFSSGIINSPSEILGSLGVGTFNQTGGNNNAGTLQIQGASGNVYSLQSGTLVASTITVAGSGEFLMTGGILGASAFNLQGGTAIFPSVVLDSGTPVPVFTIAGGSSAPMFTLSAGAALGGVNEYLGTQSGSFAFSQPSTLLFVPMNLFIADAVGSTAGYTLGAAATLTAANNETIGHFGAGTLTQTGGANTVGAILVLGDQFGSSGTYALSNSATLASGDEFVANFGGGTFTQTGGTNTLGAGSTLFLAANSGSTGTYTLSGSGSLVCGGSEDVGTGGNGTFNQMAGTNSVGALLTLADVPGSIGNYALSGGTLSAAAVYVGGSAVGAGGTGTLTVSNTGVLKVSGALQVWNGGNVGINGGSTTVGNLIISTGGHVNVTSALTINYGSPGADPAATIRGYLQTGYANNAWTGPGIASSTAAGNPGLYAVGYADGNSDPSTAASANQIVIKSTLAGDANLDGKVNFADLLAVAQNYGKTGQDWAHGDFNYDGTVNFPDLLLLAQNYHKQLSAGNLEQLPASFAAEWQLAQIELNSVPEPASSALLAMSAAALLSRRRRIPNQPRGR